MAYNLYFYDDIKSFEGADYLEARSYHWENDPPYRPEVFCKIGVVGDSLTASLKCYESEPRAMYTKRDEPMYLDSCLELFVAPVKDDCRYVNVECNSRGAFLSEFGDGKYNRALVASVTEYSPKVNAFKGSDQKGEYWGVTISLSRDFICDLYKINPQDVDFSSVRANFYKCGDNCVVPHYVAFSPVTLLPPGFHNPECFAEFKRSFMNE